VVLQHCVSSSVLRLQSQQFVTCFSFKETKLTELSAVLVPDFQSPLGFFAQSLILAADRCIDGELLVHALLLHRDSCILFANECKSLVLGTLKQESALVSVGSSTQKETISHSRLYFLHSPNFQVSSIMATHYSSMRLNFQPFTESQASLEWQLPFLVWVKSSNGISPLERKRSSPSETQTRLRRRSE
jgi:hypothetical protein